MQSIHYNFLKKKSNNTAINGQCRQTNSTDHIWPTPVALFSRCFGFLLVFINIWDEQQEKYIPWLEYNPTVGTLFVIRSCLSQMSHVLYSSQVQKLINSSSLWLSHKGIKKKSSCKESSALRPYDRFSIMFISTFQRIRPNLHPLVRHTSSSSHDIMHKKHNFLYSP